MDRNELVVTQCGGYALEQVEGAAAGLDPEVARAAERLRTGRWAYRAVKRAFDVCFSACVLVCLSWLFLIVAVAIKLDDPEGPVIFSQARVGRDGREFRMYKFRSMCADAESRLAELAGRNEKDGPVFKMADDPRVTRVGRFLRKTSIDELPQLINVVVGQMSLVGPRPPLPDEVSRYEHDVRRRLLVKPGMTGLWQVNGRSDLEWEEGVRLDLYYVENWSVVQDFMILWRTLAAVLSQKGAY